jgi:glycosyltransferase involved in cell wall biosynthesis
MENHREESKETLPAPELSVVIPAHNEEAIIEKTLDEISREFGVYEVIVVDSASTDNTRQVVEKYIADNAAHNIKVVRSELGVSNARNKGAEHALGEYVFFLDADTRYSTGFVETALAKMKKRELDAAGFNLRPDVNNILLHVHFAVHNVCQKVLAKTPQYDSVVTGAAILAKRKFVKKIGGFNPKMVLSEDADFAKRAGMEGRFGIIDERIIFNTERYRRVGEISYLRNAFRVLIGLGTDPALRDEYEKRDRYGRDI